MANSGVDPDEPASGARPRNVNVENYVTSYFSISRDKQTVRSRSKHMQSDDKILYIELNVKISEETTAIKSDPERFG